MIFGTFAGFLKRIFLANPSFCHNGVAGFNQVNFNVDLNMSIIELYLVSHYTFENP